MPYIAMPESHDPQTGAPTSYAILKHDGDDMIPVSFLRAHECPVPIQKLAENLASILNDREPLHIIESDHEIFYEPIDSGFHLRFRKKA